MIRRSSSFRTGLRAFCRQTAVTGLGRPLVDRSPGHLHRRDVRERGADGEHQRPQRVALWQPAAHLGEPSGARQLSMGVEDLGDGVAVPVLLVAPACEEGRQIRVAVGLRDQDVTQVTHGVAFDVVHVAQAAKHVGFERLLVEGTKVEVVHLQAGRSADEGGCVDSHARSTKLVVHADVPWRTCRRTLDIRERPRFRMTYEMTDLESASDAMLVVSIGRWKEEALAEVYRRHGSAVYGLARRVVGSVSLAEEVTQDVFVDLWKRPERFDPERGTLRTFLLARAHSRAVDLIRSEAARNAREERNARETVASGYDLDRYAWDLAVADRVKVAVESLPQAERRAIEMAYFDGRTYMEVAATARRARGHHKEQDPLRSAPSARGTHRPGGGGAMKGSMTHEAASELLGAFALDAVEVEDDVAIRAHLVSCARCQSELAQFHEVAGLLANAGGTRRSTCGSGSPSRSETTELDVTATRTAGRVTGTMIGTAVTEKATTETAITRTIATRSCGFSARRSRTESGDRRGGGEGGV